MTSNALKVLAIDDNRDNLTTLGAVLKDALPDCVLLTALGGRTGIELARREDPDAILLDVVMSGMDGFEVCRSLKAEPRLRDIPVIFLTALVADRGSRIRALAVGAEAFLTKPPDEQELAAHILAMAKGKAANRLQRMEREELSALVAERTRELVLELTERRRVEQLQLETLAKLRTTFEGVIETMMRAVEIRDPYTAGHQRRVAHLAHAIGAELGLPEEVLDAILFAGNIHDIGKIAVPVEILAKPGRLSPIEFGLIKEHSRRGYEMLRPISFPWPLPEIVLQHHERLDGTGYPDGVWRRDPSSADHRRRRPGQAMASDRPYRPALGIIMALGEITKQSGRASIRPS